MAYAGICSPQDIQAHSDPYFHTINFDEIITNITTGSTGLSGCALVTATGNNPPVATVGGTAYTIPFGTPFILTGSAFDADGDPLTYYWEQFDLGSASAPGSPLSSGPRFRSYSPTTTPDRIVPNYPNVLSGTVPIGEILPTGPQNARFRLTVRDNRSVGGGVNYDVNYCNLTIAAAGPFTVASPTLWAPGTAQTVTWTVNGTDVSPVSCSMVNILISDDGGLTFPYTLAFNTPNDGSELIVVPGISSTNVRMKVEAAGNIFFAITSAFEVNVVPPPTITAFSPATTIIGGIVNITGTEFSSATNVSFGGAPAASFVINSSTSITAIVGAGNTGDVSVTSGGGTAAMSGFTLAGAYAGSYGTLGSGTSSNTATTFPAPYGNWYGAAKHQMLYTAAELTAAGFTAGFITEFGFNVSTLVPGSLNDLTLKMSNTSSTSLTSTFVSTGLTTVYSNASYTPVNGWNLHQLSTPFMWDGTSNILVESCFNNNNTGTTGNTSTVYTTGLTSNICRYYRVDNSATACAATAATGGFSTRANGKFFVVPTPTVSASGLVFSAIGNTSVTLGWTNGNGGNRIVICSPTSSAQNNPVNLTDYMANAHYGWGNSLGANNYLVYNGSGSAVTVTGLSPVTSYTFRVIEYNGLPGFNNYKTTGVSGSPVSTLPVTWLSFDGVRTGKQAQLAWSTASETNNQCFSIERSADNTEWKQAGTVKAKGNSTTITQYYYSDALSNELQNQDLFYRLKQTDMNGAFSFSKVLFLESKTQPAATLKIQPNPASGSFTLISDATPQQPATVKLFDELGLEVLQLTIFTKEMQVPVSGLGKGMYIVAVTIGSNTAYQKLMVR
jgi:hypothetical protein